MSVSVRVHAKCCFVCAMCSIRIWLVPGFADPYSVMRYTEDGEDFFFIKEFVISATLFRRCCVLTILYKFRVTFHHQVRGHFC